MITLFFILPTKEVECNWYLFYFSLSKDAKQDAAVKHALAVHASVLSCNYVQFFKLYKKAPNLNSCLMGKEQYTSLKCNILLGRSS
jgi:hypothetical protein